MIVRQQEELRQVKEQLLLARLGILQPIINVSILGIVYMGASWGTCVGHVPQINLVSMPELLHLWLIFNVKVLSVKITIIFNVC